MKVLTAIPVYNEERHLEGVLREVRRYSPKSSSSTTARTDRTAGLAGPPGRRCTSSPIRTTAATGPLSISAFDYALATRLRRAGDDGLRRPARAGRIPVLLEAIHDADIVSGSRYLRDFRQDTLAPQDRRQINRANHAGAERPLRPAPDRRLLRLQGLPPRGAGPAAHHRNGLGHAAAAVGAGGAGWDCASRKSACRGCISIRTGPSAACSTMPRNAWPTIAA